MKSKVEITEKPILYLRDLDTGDYFLLDNELYQVTDDKYYSGLNFPQGYDYYVCIHCDSGMCKQILQFTSVVQVNVKIEYSRME